MAGRASTAVVAVLVLVSVVTASQLAFTDVGREVGGDWSSPTAIDSLDAGRDADITSVAVASETSSDGESVVAWIVKSGDTWRVKTAPLSVQEGTVSVGDQTVVATSSVELVTVDVAADTEPVVVWERQPDNQILLARPGTEPTVVSNGSLRVAQPSVALADGTPVIAWQAYGEGGYATVARTPDSAVTTVGDAVSGRGSPAVTATGKQVAVVWMDPDGTSIRARQATGGDPLAFGEEQTLGRARPLGGFGSGQGSVALAATSDASGVRAAWTDVGVVTIGGTSWAGAPQTSMEVASGGRPGIATSGDQWLAAWLVENSASGSDVDYALGTTDGATTRGPVSRLASSANHPRPVFAPDAGIVWTERGSQTQLLASAHRSESAVGPVTRLTRSFGRFVFIGLAAAFVGTVTVVVMPWTFFAYLLAFILTTRVALNRTTRLLAWLSGIRGERRRQGAIETDLRHVPTPTWVAVFAILDTALLVVLLPASVQSTALSFTHPLGVSLIAAAGTIPVLAIANLRSAWRASVVFAYLQTAALWTTALPAVM